MTDEELLAVLDEAADAVRRALAELHDWGPSGTKTGQYRSDLVADDACLGVLDAAGLGWLSEESGARHVDRSIVVVVDPVDGSTNAARGIPWFATSLCAVDADGPRVAVVADLARARRFRAVRGGGASVDGRPIAPSGATELADAVIGLSGHPARHPGSRQFRALGAVALDLCAVAEGVLDGYLDCSPSAHGAWDYAGGLLVCQEAGAAVVDAFDRPLVTFDHVERRTPVAGASAQLLAELVDVRRSMRADGDPPDPEKPGSPD